MLNAHRSIFLTGLAIAVCSLTLTLTPASALAEQRGHVTTPREFGSGLLKEPDGVAVNEATGVVYVADSGHDRVELFNGTTGASLGEINGSGKRACERRARRQFRR